MQIDAAVDIIARHLLDDSIVALVGSAASATYIDESGRRYPGLPTVSEMTGIARQRFSYVTENDSFNSAFDKIIGTEHRRTVETLLLQYYKIPSNFEIPPCHKMLSWLPFSAYITSNYDQFIERSLDIEKRRPLALIENQDLADLKKRHTPVIKYHGCVTRPSTMVAASRDYEALLEKQRIINRYLSSTLAGKALLVLGHGLGDYDLNRTIREITAGLGEYAPSVFVIRPVAGTISQDMNIGDIRHEVIVDDMHSFLRRLLQEIRTKRGQNLQDTPNEHWLNSAFFSALRQASVLPTETQVIDTFLSHLLEELRARDECASVLTDAGVAVGETLRERPNYEALGRVWDSMRESIVCEDPSEVELVVRGVIQERMSLATRFSEMGNALVRPSERILVYSQSRRVIQVLQGVPGHTQKTVDLFVSECRPKSPNPYQDACEFSELLSDSSYLITVCPDVVALSLIINNQIDKVLLGAHAIYTDSAGNPHSFVNTCGSAALARVAESKGIPVIVVAEKLKVRELSYERAVSAFLDHQEHDITHGVFGLREIATRRAPLNHTNIGYDLVSVTSNVTVKFADQDVGD